ncbi:type I-E CRISPR-associated protein Cas6/Cse3/CasE [Nocardiopsis lucentensis]|uniref:type I-E CRISPR-associated protein Cas6/Cse3/CasE n=1 Tax=Nocardiopsis lucentensis TaxID=53441 RepID=UPI00034C36E8|nr:type I-E CRISPR-associated protein Cas6/Cse3/CasE [Nocardiopsis lucentensis]
MYLTRFRFNTARAGARKVLSSPQVTHAAVMSAFADEVSSNPGGARVLWRVDHNAKTEVYLYVVSPAEPDLTHLVEQAGWPKTGTWQTREYAPLLDRLEEGQTWAFRLAANPVHSVRVKDGQPTKRTAHVTPRHQMGWLLERQERLGFEVPRREDGAGARPEDAYELMVHNRQARRFNKVEQATGEPNRVPLTSVTFDGRLRITDPDTLRHALVSGIGRAKAYGCGLMTLAPV